MPRKKPFSSKQKKLQLQEKRRRKRGERKESNDEDEEDLLEVNKQPQDTSQKYDPNRYRLHFFKESQEEINTRKLNAKRNAIKQKEENDLEINFDVIYPQGSIMDIPKRPPWNYQMSKHVLEATEERYFQEYVAGILSKHSPQEISYFEMNLETWRQLWRVLEISDVLLLIIDVRYPVLHFSPALYDYVTKDLQKYMVVIINKIDLAPVELTIAWKHYLLSKFPDLKIVFFSSYPSEAVQGNISQQKRAKKRRVNRFTQSTGVGQLLKVCQEIVQSKGRSVLAVTTFTTTLSNFAEQSLKVCQEIVQSKVDLSSWEEKIHSDVYDNGEECSEGDNGGDMPDLVEKYEMFSGGVLTIGCVGYPNVGKSSLLNGLVGKKVVSVSKTPGHTKHFQTIYLTPTVKLCDCPGLVFPSVVDKSLQILAGIFPIAQVREPYSPVGFLSERLNLPQQLHLRHNDIDEGDDWTPFDICEAWALQKGFLTAKAARPDAYRAANHLLRLALDGRICLCLRPPGFTKNRESWVNHPETKELIKELIKFKPNDDEEMSGESTEDELEHEKEDNSDSSEERDETMASRNPFSLLSGDH